MSKGYPQGKNGSMVRRNSERDIGISMDHQSNSRSGSSHVSKTAILNLADLTEEKQKKLREALATLGDEEQELLIELATRYALAKDKFLSDPSISNPDDVLDPEMAQIADRLRLLRSRAEKDTKVD